MSRQKGKSGIYSVSKASKEVATSQQIESEHWGQHNVLNPTIEPTSAIKAAKESDILPQIIDAYASNIALHGWGIKYKDEFDYNNADENRQIGADREWNSLADIFKYFNLSMSFERILYKSVYDMATIGYGVIEILRDGTGSICGGEYARACDFRVSSDNSRYVDIVQHRMIGDKEIHIGQKKKFKKFVQNVNGKKVYFKEFGDPRTINCTTGEYEDETPESDIGTEILMITSHSCDSDYGEPIWGGTIPNVAGNRKSELVNIKFFDNGKITPFAITVTNGLLTDESMETLRTGKGLDNFFNCLLLEAKANEDGTKIKGISDTEQKISLDIKSLIDTSLKDGLFQEYQSNNRTKIRSSFRLPPIYLGESQDYTRATADTSRRIAEEQIFIPFRKYIADLFNITMTNELCIKYVELYLKGPELSENEELANALAPFIQAGAVTPNALIDVLSKILGKDLEPLPDDIGNIPLEIQKVIGVMQQNNNEVANEAVDDTQNIKEISKSINTLERYLWDDEDD